MTKIKNPADTGLIKAAEQFAKAATTVGSDGGAKVTASEVQTALDILQSNAHGQPLAKDKLNSLIKAFKGAQFDAPARTKFYQATGVLPPGGNIPHPPIVALYAVAIHTAVASGDVHRMQAMRMYAEEALGQHGGTTAPARPMALSASVSSLNAEAAAAGHPVNDVRAAHKALVAKLTELGHG